MKECYHTTKTKFLSSILEKGLQPIYGDNSHLISDFRTSLVYYSVGMQGATDTFSSFDRFYNNVLEGGINEERFKQVLSPDDYAKHQKSIEIIKNSSSFEDWIKDNIYLCFDGDYLSEKNEDRASDAFTTQSIPVSQLKACVIRNTQDDTFYSYSMLDIYSFFFAKNPELEEGLCTYDYIENINKFKSDKYILEYIELEKFCEMFPELLEEKKSTDEGITFQQIGKHTSKDAMLNLEKAILAMNTLESEVKSNESTKEVDVQI